ncbi:MAG: hypothetical protein DDT23_00032 [candidate division WS2 bacterium]|nr:hypothetical protein [Candidatus Lithacetigena glycinireducens]
MLIIIEILLVASVLAAFVEAIVEIIKKNTVIIIHPRIYSLLVGLILGSFLVEILNWDIYQSFVTGAISGLVSAPVLHDVTAILRNLKDCLKDNNPSGDKFPI